MLFRSGAGAVGNAAIQLARRGGAHVIATVSSPAKADLAEAAGAHVIINYRDSDAVEQVKAAARAGVDRVIEVNLTDNLDLDLAVLTSQGVIVTYAADRPDPTIPVRKLMFGNTVLRFAIVYSFTQSMLDAATSKISAALEEGALTPLPFLRYSLDQISAAHDAVEGRAVGKVLIDLPV